MISTLHAIPDTDWLTHSNAQLATQLRLKPNYVGVYRRLYKKPKGPRSPGSGRPSRLDVSEIDWSLSNTENAARLNCTPQYVAYLRRNKNSIEDFA